MTKTALLLTVEYDETKTDAESLAGAFDTLLATALSTPGVLDDYGDVTAGEFYPSSQNPDRPHAPDVVIDVADEAAAGLDRKPLAFRLREDGYGASVEAHNDRGQPMGSVTLDYNNNVLRGFVTVGWDEEPHTLVKISTDVEADRTKDLSEEGTRGEARSPA